MGKLIKELSLKSHYKIAFWTTLVIAILLIIISFILPPTGSIDPSVLEGTGLLLLWPAMMLLCKALEEGKTATIRHKDTEISVGDNASDMPMNNEENIEL